MSGRFSVVARPVWHSLHYNVQFSIRWVPMEAKFLKLHQIETKNLQLDPKTFQKILVSSYCVTLFFRLCLANLTFLVLQCPIFNGTITHGSKSYQIVSNSYLKPLTRSKDFSGNLSFKLLSDVIFLSLPGQSNFPCFTMATFLLADYHW